MFVKNYLIQNEIITKITIKIIFFIQFIKINLKTLISQIFKISQELLN
jgi:hypothetical protein